MFADHTFRIRQNQSAGYAGVAVADLLGHGRPQFYVYGAGGANRVLSWVDGALVDRTPRALAGVCGASVAASAADVDGDGVEELLLLNEGHPRQPDRLYSRDGAGHWHDLLSHPTARAARRATPGRCAAAIDRRGGGRYGFVIAHPDHPTRLLEVGADAQLADLAPALGLDTPGDVIWVGSLMSDRPDVYIGNAHTPNRLFRNTGCTTFLEIAAAVGAGDPSEATVAVAGLDADEDGHLDLLVGNRDGANRLFYRQADGLFRDRATPAMAFPGALRGVVAADFDNDGHEELFFHFHGEPNRLFRRAPTNPLDWILTDAGPATDPDGFGTGLAVADLDGDGRLELLLARGRGGSPLGLFKVEAGDNHWLRVQPLTRFGAPARGAVVRLRAGGRTQLRVIDGGGGPAQTEPVAHFGLGSAATVDEVRVTWPDGATATLPSPPVRRHLDVCYPR